MSKFSYHKIAILGPGLLGGSLALALREQLKGETRIALWGRRAEVIEEARRLAIADEADTDLFAVVRDADLVVLCTPVDVMPALAEQIAGALPKGALITDVGSVKGPVVEALVPIFEKHEALFIGSHPMAGSEQSGLHAAKADLFEGSTAIVTPHEGANPEAVEAVRQLWSGVGCRVRELSPGVHDETVGLVSHLPHFLAAALAEFVHAEDWGATAFCGNGFRDTTRIASGPAEMWSGIFAQNRTAVIGQLERFIASLTRATDALQSGDDAEILAFLQRAKAARDTLTPSS